MSASDKIAVVIVNWNNWLDTVACIEWLVDVAPGGHELEIIIVDNGSTDASLENLRGHEAVTLLPLPENVGFAAGSNHGIRMALAAGAAYVLLLNNDTYARAEFLMPLLATFDQQPRAAIVCPKIRYAGETESVSGHIWYAGGKFRHPRLIGEMVGMDEVDLGQYDTECTVDFGVGCCMLIKSDLFHRIGLLDEAFFFYHEDADFSLRATQAGYEVWYQPAALVWHHVSRSTEENPGFRAFLYARSRPIFFVKHIRGLQWIPVLGLEVVRLVRTVARSLLQGRPGQGIGYLRGSWQGWRSALMRDEGAMDLSVTVTEHNTQ